MPNHITELGNRIIPIDLSLAGHGCTATYSLGPPGGHCQVNFCCLNSLRHDSPWLFCCLSAKAQHLSLSCNRSVSHMVSFEEGCQSLPGCS